MKSREQKKKWTGKKHVWYGAAGLFCLVAAVLVLILGNGIGAKAEPLNMGDKTLDFVLDNTDNYYEIKDGAQLAALGNATEEQTRGKNFKLVNDLDISSITAASTGTFAGTFDGKGYVITIENLKIKDSISGSAHGVLFGTVTGTVQNIIVDVKDENASYTGISDAGLNLNDSKEPIIIPQKAYALNKPISELDTNMQEAYDAISGKNMPEKGSENYDTYVDEYGVYEDVYLDPKTNIEYKENADGRVWYRKLTRTVGEKTTHKNTAKDAENDSFGIVCGELSGTLSQISVNGQTISIHHQPAKSGTTGLVETSTSLETYYYKVEEGDIYKFSTEPAEGDWNKNVSVEAPTLYETKNISGNNMALPGFSLKVSAPQEVAATGASKEYSIEYTITIMPLDTTTSSTITLTASETGTWSGTGITITSSNTCTVSNITSNTEVKFTYKGTDVSGNKSMSFSGIVMDSANGQTAKTKDVSVSTKIVAGSDQTKSGSSAELTSGMMTVEIVQKKTNSGEYTMTVSNTSTSAALKDIVITYPEGWTVSSTDNTVKIDQNSRTVTIANLDKATSGWKVTPATKTLTIKHPGTTETTTKADGTTDMTISYPTAGELIGQNISVTAETNTTPEQTLSFSKNTTNAQITNDVLAADDLTISATAPQYVKNGSSVNYNVSFTSKQAGTITLKAMSNGTEVSGTWSPSVTDVSVDANQMPSFTFTPTDAASNPQSITFTASSSNGSACQTSITVGEYNGSNGTPVNASATSIDANSLQLEATSDPVIEIADGATVAEVCYKLTVTGNQGGTVTITAPEAGKWGTSEDAAKKSSNTSATYTDTLSSNADKMIYYIRNYNLTGTTWPQEVKAENFSVKQIITDTSGGEQTCTATTTDDLPTAVYSKSAAVKTVTASGGYENLTVTLKRPAYIVDGEAKNYTLTIKNKVQVSNLKSAQKS